MAGEYTPEELEALLKKAYSVESRAAHGCEHYGMDQVGIVQHGNRIIHVYVDTGGNSWYSTEFLTEHGVVSEFEYIFGMTEKQMEYRRKARNRA